MLSFLQCLLPMLGHRVLAVARTTTGIGDATCENDAGEKACQGEAGAVPPYWPYKGGNLNRSGFSPHVGAVDLVHPSWLFEEPDRFAKEVRHPNRMKVFHSSPIIDANLNVFIQSTTGWVYSMDRWGRLRWSFDTTDFNPGNLALLDGILYTATQGGVAWAIDATTGNEVWRRKVAIAFPSDTHSLVAVGDIVLTACNRFHTLKIFNRSVDFGNENVCALHATDGSLKWNYSMTERSNNISYNQQLAVVDNSVVFSDVNGGVYRVSLEEGREIWFEPGVTSTPPSFTTGTLVVGPNDAVYNVFNEGPYFGGQTGWLRVHDIRTGAVLWNRSFHEGVNAAPTVGPTRPGGPLAVVVAVGDNAACWPYTRWTRLKQWLGLERWPALHGKILALDALTGETLWSFDAPPWNNVVAGSTWQDKCCADIWGNLAIDSDGTVYANWSGGKAFALRDANGDGRIDPDDDREVSSYHHGFGSNGITAIAPGLTVVPSCRQIIGYAT